MLTIYSVGKVMFIVFGFSFRKGDEIYERNAGEIFEKKGLKVAVMMEKGEREEEHMKQNQKKKISYQLSVLSFCFMFFMPPSFLPHSFLLD